MKKSFVIPAFIFFFFMTFTSDSCKKTSKPTADNPYGLPNATQTGAQVFAYRFNGQSWIAKAYNPYVFAGISKVLEENYWTVVKSTVTSRTC